MSLAAQPTRDSVHQPQSPCPVSEVQPNGDNGQVERGADQASDILSAALAYALRGWQVFPLNYIIDGECSCGDPTCGSPGKHPLTQHGLYDASVEVEQVSRWWSENPSANIGIVTGAASGILVIDLDGDTGRDSFYDLLKEHNSVALDTLGVRTGGGGYHLYFGYPQNRVRNSASKLATRVDVRGDGGYVVAPPSMHATGSRYEWLDAEVPIVSLPEWMLGLLVKPTPLTSANISGNVIPEGERNAALASLAGVMRRRGMSHEAISAALLEENTVRCKPPLDESEVCTIAASISRYAPADSAQANLNHQKPEPSAGDCTEIDGAILVQDLESFINRFVVLPPATTLPLALWCVSTHLFEQFEAFPYLAVLSPLKRCGKTRLTEIIELVAANPRMTVNISEAALFRLIEGSAPTLILDEAEALSGKSERAEAVRALLNAGNRRGAQVPRCVGNSHELQWFSVYCPKVVCGIRVCPDTIRDRSIVISMQRRKSTEAVERFRRRLIANEASALRERIAAFADRYKAAIVASYDAQDLPFLEDRDEEAWQPLFAVLAVANAARSGELRSMAEALTQKKADADKDDVLAMKLLADIRAVFGERTE